MHYYLCVSAEEGEELRERGDPHPVHELAGPRGPRGATFAPEAEAACQRFQELLQRPHRRPLQVNSSPQSRSANTLTSVCSKYQNEHFNLIVEQKYAFAKVGCGFNFF